MKIKKFVAPTMKEALEMIKAEMGPEAFVLSSKQIEQPGTLGIGTRTMLQVVAAFEEVHVEELKQVENKEIKKDDKFKIKKTQKPRSTANPSLGSITQALKENNLLYNKDGKLSDNNSNIQEKIEKLIKKPVEVQEAEPISFSYQLKPIRKELMEIKTMITGIQGIEHNGNLSQKTVNRDLDEVKSLLKSFIKNASPVSSDNVPTDFLAVYNSLLENDFEKEIAANIVLTAYKRKKKEPSTILSAYEFVKEVIKDSVLVSGPVQLSRKKAKVIAVLGPTGVGKTTTIAKLAAYSTLNLQMKVALITMDTFRIAAVEQLSKFAEILDAPINIALNAVDLHNAINFHKDRSLILIDTPGMSHKDSEKMNELLSLIEKEENIEKHLALSVATKQKDMEDIIEKFKIFDPSNIIFTKLDESSSYGNIYNQMVKSSIPVSYITNGQNVPDDIEIAKSDTLTNLLLNNYRRI